MELKKISIGAGSRRLEIDDVYFSSLVIII